MLAARASLPSTPPRSPPAGPRTLLRPSPHELRRAALARGRWAAGPWPRLSSRTPRTPRRLGAPPPARGRRGAPVDRARNLGREKPVTSSPARGRGAGHGLELDFPPFLRGSGANLGSRSRLGRWGVKLQGLCFVAAGSARSRRGFSHLFPILSFSWKSFLSSDIFPTAFRVSDCLEEGECWLSVVEEKSDLREGRTRMSPRGRGRNRCNGCRERGRDSKQPPPLNPGF